MLPAQPHKHEFHAVCAYHSCQLREFADTALSSKQLFTIMIEFGLLSKTPRSTLMVILQHVPWCYQGPPADTMAGLARVRHAHLNTTLLQKCIKMRRTVYKKMTGSGLKSQATRQAVYK